MTLPFFDFISIVPSSKYVHLRTPKLGGRSFDVYPFIILLILNAKTIITKLLLVMHGININESIGIVFDAVFIRLFCIMF